MKTNRNGILITGATGYIGYNFSKYMVEKGFDVHLLVRKTSNLKDLENRKHTNIHYYNGKTDSIEKIFNSDKIDFVVHLATYYDISDNPITLNNLNDVCIGLTTHLFEAIKKQKHSVVFINVGTIWQTHEQIENAYTLYKILQEELVKYYSKKYEIKSLSLLLTDTYGPSDVRPKLLNYIKSSVRENKTLNIMNPNASINLVYIDDVCSALNHSTNLLETQDDFFNRYKVQAEATIKLRDLISLCETTYRFPIKVEYGAQTQIPQMKLGIEVEPLPGWKPRVDITCGLIRFFKNEDVQ